MSNAERAKRIAEIETLIDELKDKATGLADDSGFNVTYDVPAGILHKILGWRDGASGYVTELPPESAQEPRCPKCGCQNVTFREKHALCLNGECDFIVPRSESYKFFGPASQEVRELVEAARMLDSPIAWWDEETRMCRLCRSRKETSEGLIIHSDSCAMKRLRSALAALKEKTHD